jgi:lysozyme
MKALEIASSIASIFEGLFLKPYRCPANVPTIGRGTTRYPDGRKVTMQDPPITVAKADLMLDYEMKKSLSSAIKYCPVLLVSDEKWGSIADFVYNLGAGNLQCSTLRRKINAGDWPGARKELMKWVRGGGRVLPGLVKRRAIEASLLKG